MSASLTARSVFKNHEQAAALNAGVRLFLRGVLQVSLTAANVSFIARHNIAGAFLVGTGISVVWWFNAHDRSPLRAASLIYGLGAGCGTVLGMELVRWWP